ncbi:MAG: TetR/AcrR family transcriptional regulator [Oscillospiraceae bacterium]
MNKKQEANEFVRECITTALFQLMKEMPLENISITALTKKAGVSRVSFYRNFDSREDIIRQYLAGLTVDWAKDFEREPSADLIESIFSHYRRHKDVFILLYKRGLWHLSLQSIKDACGPKPGQDDLHAYRSAFISYGLYGWLEEWFRRGLPDIPEELKHLPEQAQNSILP